MIGVILAAGKGSRLGNYTTDLPKSLLPLNDNNDTLLDYNLRMLERFKLEKILIVTGFNADKLEKHVESYKNIEVVYNPFWNHCNVLGSLYMALNSIKDDFLFLHADTLAVEEIWTNLYKADGEMVLPFERKQCGLEEMKVLLKENKVIQISKEIDFNHSDGEFLGIAKFKKSTIPYFKKTAERLFKNGDLNHYMESVIQEAINDNMFNITAMDILDYNFVEVDFEEDYSRAKAEFGNMKT
jgi:choline kinase